MFHASLFFSGTGKEAFTRYQEIFGGELFLMSAAEVPGGGRPGVPPEMIIHAALMLESGGMLMASDDPTGDGAGTKGVSVSFTAGDTDEARRVFDALADGGKVDSALEETFFSPSFGTCTDRWGVAWMVNAKAPEGT